MTVDEFIQIVVFIGILFAISCLIVFAIAMREAFIVHRQDKREKEKIEWDLTWPKKRIQAFKSLGLSEEDIVTLSEHTPVRLLPRPYDWQREQNSNAS